MGDLIDPFDLSNPSDYPAEMARLREHITELEKRVESAESAGLIEAAEWLEQRAPACYAATTAREWAAELRKEVAVRARAADRGGK